MRAVRCLIIKRLNVIKVWVFFGKIVEKKHLRSHDKNHYYF